MQSFRRQFQYIYNVLPRMGGSLFSRGFDQYMKSRLAQGLRFPLEPAAKRRITRARNELLRRRERFDPLMGQLEQWGAAQREPWEELVIDDQVEARWPSREAARTENELRYSIKGMTSLLANRYTVDELVTLSCRGDDESLFRLIELDKVFLTAAFARERILRAQWGEDWQFFRSLSRSVAIDSYRRNLRAVRVGIACYLLWFLGFRNLPRDQLLDFLETHKLVKYEDPYSFYHMLNRIGLRKYRKVAQRKR
jgi:hypothetical protein